MGKFIAKLGDDAYVEWSTVVDSPTTFVMPRPEAVAEFGEDRIARADRKGTSLLDDPAVRTPDEIVLCNRAGPDESELTVEQMLAAFDPGDPAPWTVA